MPTSRLNGPVILYDDDDEPQYVRIADRLGERIGVHQTDHLEHNWTRFSWFGNKLLPDGQDRVEFAEPPGAIGVRPKRLWHDFEAVLFHASRFSVAPSGYGDGLGTQRGGNRRAPYFGGDAQKWTQVKKGDKPAAVL